MNLDDRAELVVCVSDGLTIFAVPCSGCQFSVPRGTDDCYFDREMGTSQARRATRAHASRIKARMVHVLRSSRDVRPS